MTDDAISRREAVTAFIEQAIFDGFVTAHQNDGGWEMFELITSTWYGKHCYFKERGGIVYSRISHEYMSADDAIMEFLNAIGDNG